MPAKLSPIPIKPHNEADKKSAEVLIYESIGDDGWGGGLDAKTFADNLKALGSLDEITVRINSPGGSAWDGMAIFNTLVANQAKVVVCIDGIAASAASFIAQAASPGELHMAENALMMIHLASGMTWGNYKEHDKTSEILQQHDKAIAQTYARRSGRKQDSFLNLMEDETWMTAQEAVDHKLADDITPAKKVDNCFDLKLLNRFKHTPEDIAKRLQLIENDNHEHRTEKCSCGKIIFQCRCASPKETVVIPNGCDDCKQKIAESVVPEDDTSSEGSADNATESEAIQARLRKLEMDGVLQG